MNELELTALDGANPLGFLAALGTMLFAFAPRDFRLLENAMLKPRNDQP